MIFYRLSIYKVSNAKCWQICANKSLAKFSNPHPAASGSKNQTSKSLVLLIFKIKELGPKLPWKAWWWTNIKVLWQKWNWFQDKVHRVLQGLRWSPARSSFEIFQILRNNCPVFNCRFEMWNCERRKVLFQTKDSWASKEDVRHGNVLFKCIVVLVVLLCYISDSMSGLRYIINIIGKLGWTTTSVRKVKSSPSSEDFPLPGYFSLIGPCSLSR